MEFGGGAAPVWVLRLTAERGMTATQVLIVAIDRMAREYADSGVVEVAPAVGELIGPGTPGGRIDKNVTRGFTDCRADLFRGCAGLLYAISVHPAPQEPAGSGWRVFCACPNLDGAPLRPPFPPAWRRRYARLVSCGLHGRGPLRRRVP